MKVMTCKQLGGACDLELRAETFEEIAELSKQHGVAMYQARDPDHLAAMQKMAELMKSPEVMSRWQADRRKEFDDLPQL